MKILAKNILIPLLAGIIILPLKAEDVSMDKYLQYVENEDDVTEIVFLLTQMLEAPFNINTVTRDRLNQLPFLNDEDIDNIIQYRIDFGDFFSLNELGFMPPEKMDLLKDFMFIAPKGQKISTKRLFQYGKNNLLVRGVYKVNKEVAFTETDPSKRFEGDPFQTYLRYQFTSSDRLKFNFIAEKDRGEAFFGGSNPHGFDQYSSSLEWKNSNSWLQKIIVGDYKLSFGQGLNIWQGYTRSKANDIEGIIRRETQAVSNSGAMEFGYFRGSALSVKLGNFLISPFVSYQSIDASLDDSGRMTSLPVEDGNHRTPGERKKEDAVQYFVTGTNAAYNGSNFHIGYTGYYLQSSAPYVPRISLYNQAVTTGDRFWAQGIDYKWRVWHKFHLFGEMSLDKEYSRAYLTGISIPINFSVKLLMSYRDYAADYYNFFGDAFAESNIRNEKGLFTGVRALLSPAWTMNAYIDRYKLPFYRYGIDYLNTKGLDMNLRFDYNARPWTAYIQAKQETKEGENSLDELETELIHRFRGRARYYISDNWTTTTQVDFNRSNNTEGVGNAMSVYQELAWSSASPWAINGRIMWFDVANNETRITLYERNVLYGFNLKTLYEGAGLRGILNASYKWERWKFWFRYANTYFTRPSESFIDKYNTEWEQDICLQAQWRF